MQISTASNEGLKWLLRLAYGALILGVLKLLLLLLLEWQFFLGDLGGDGEGTLADFIFVEDDR